MVGGVEASGGAVGILAEIARPTAPFAEHQVARAVRGLLQRWRLPEVRWEFDAFGNLFISHRCAGDPQDWSLVLLAHMDHPGFEVLEYQGRDLLLGVLGGAPVALLAGERLRVLGPRGLLGATLALEQPSLESGFLRAQLDEEPEQGLAGAGVTFAMPDFAQEGSRIRGLAMDDLVGCAAALSTLKRVAEAGLAVDLWVVLHRAEEAGFVGTTAAASQQRLPKRCVVVSLEASKVVPGVEQGAGPVIRTADRRFRFHPDPEHLLRLGARRLAERGLPVQRAAMTGGTCEASIYQAMGYCATALAIPLRNYHNRGDHRVAPEEIDSRDLEGAAELLWECARVLPEYRLPSRRAFLQARRARMARFLPRLLQPFPDPPAEDGSAES